MLGYSSLSEELQPYEYLLQFTMLFFGRKVKRLHSCLSATRLNSQQPVSGKRRLNNCLKTDNCQFHQDSTRLYKEDSNEDLCVQKFSLKYVMSKLPLRFSTSRCSKSLEFQIILSPDVCSSCFKENCTFDSNLNEGTF